MTACHSREDGNPSSFYFESYVDAYMKISIKAVRLSIIRPSPQRKKGRAEALPFHHLAVQYATIPIA